MFTMNSSSELSAILFLLYKNAALIRGVDGIVWNNPGFVHNDY